MATSAPRADAGLRASVDPWFEQHGVPHFCDHYSARKRLPTLLLLLSSVVAFEIGVAPWIKLSATQLLIGLGILVALALWLRPALMALLGLADWDRAWWSLPARLVSIILVGYLLAKTDLPPLWSNPWVDFGVVFGCLATFVVLSDDAMWRGSSLSRGRWTVVGLTVSSVIVFALEGSVIAPFDAPLTDAARAVEPSLAPVPQALPALIVVAIILALSLHLARTSSEEAGALAPASGDETAARVGAVIPALPLLILVLCGETAVLPHAIEPGWLQALPLLALAFLAWPATKMSRRAMRWGWIPTYVRAHVSALWALWALIAVYLFAFPALAWVYFDVDVFGTTVDGWRAFAVTLAINLLYLAVAWGIVSFGLDRVAAWAWRGARANVASVFKGLARGLPLLLLFAGFFVFTAEIWEIAVEMSTPAFLALAGLLVTLTGVFVAITSLNEIRRQCEFETKSDVCAAVAGTQRRRPPEEPPPAPFDAAMQRFSATADEEPRSFSLQGVQRINALAVLSVYQSLVFVPVVLASAGLFWILGRLAVPPEVAISWIEGDDADPRRAPTLVALDFWDEPWTRVAVLLAIFSMLYLAATVLSNRDQRAEFFEGADRAIRQRIAVLLVYRHGSSRPEPPAQADDLGACPVPAAPQGAQTLA